MIHSLDKKKIVYVSEHATPRYVYLHLLNEYLAPSNTGQKFWLKSAVILVK